MFYPVLLRIYSAKKKSCRHPTHHHDLLCLLIPLTLSCVSFLISYVFSFSFVIFLLYSFFSFFFRYVRLMLEMTLHNTSHPSPVINHHMWSSHHRDIVSPSDLAQAIADLIRASEIKIFLLLGHQDSSLHLIDRLSQLITEPASSNVSSCMCCLSTFFSLSLDQQIMLNTIFIYLF